MVEELDLTDHDVSVIAAMIDSEIQFHIPDWAPRELSGNNSSTGEAIQETSVSGAHEDASPTTNDSIQSGPLILEKLPSGRKYWSDSPKASGECSPLRPGPSNLCRTDSAASGDSWAEEHSESPLNTKDVNMSYDASPLRPVEYDSCAQDDYRKQEVERYVYVGGCGPYPLEGHTVPCGTDLGDISNIVEKLEHVLDEQLKELDELKEKHKLAVIDLLEELPQESRQRVLSICNKKIPGHKVDMGMEV